MLCINQLSNDPYFNLATEEYLLKNFTEDIFMLWRNEASIIVGKHQNTLAEINIEYVKNNQIPVVRRMTGGGTVFHDLGNINFTFIARENKGDAKDFMFFTQPVIVYLRKLEVNAVFEGRNDLTIDGKKFSGNARLIFGNSILHHGTLLFSSELSELSKALNVNERKFEGKAVKSVRARVTNISEHLPEKMNVQRFMAGLFEFVSDISDLNKPYSFTNNDIESIEKLRNEKYATWEWNYGNSPKFNFRKEFKTNGGYFDLHLEIEKGKIMDMRIFGDFFSKIDINLIENALVGLAYNQEEIKSGLAIKNLDDSFYNVSIDEFVAGLFSN